jgi:hypothetical protein
VEPLKTPLVIGIVVILVVVAGAGLVLFQAPPSQVKPSDTRQPPGQPEKAQTVQVKQITAAPTSYAGKTVDTEGTVRKDYLLATPYLLDDGTASLSLRFNTDADRYVGLKVRVSGIIRYDPQAFNAPSTSMQIQSIKILDSEPSFYVEMSKEGIDDRGRPTLSRLLVYDNSGTLTVYERVNAKVLLTNTMTKERMDEIRKGLIDAGVFSLQQQEYPAKSASETFTYSIKVILKVGNELKQNRLTWTEPASAPEELLKLQGAFNTILNADSP